MPNVHKTPTKGTLAASRAAIVPCSPTNIKYHEGFYFLSYVTVNSLGQECPNQFTFTNYADAHHEMNTARMLQGYKTITLKTYKGK